MLSRAKKNFEDTLQCRLQSARRNSHSMLQTPRCWCKFSIDDGWTRSKSQSQRVIDERRQCSDVWKQVSQTSD